MNTFNEVAEQTEEEVAIKLRLYKMALEDGELDNHLEPMTLKQRYQMKFHRIVDAVLNEETDDIGEKQYKSLLAMVYTLIEDDRTEQLINLIQDNFPEYYHNHE